MNRVENSKSPEPPMEALRLQAQGRMSHGLKAIVVTGTPGTGKTEFSKHLSSELGIRYVDLNEFLIKERCFAGFDEGRGSFIVDLNKGREIYRKFFDKVKCVVDSHVAHLIVPKELVRICFILRTSPYMLMNRLKKVGFNEEKIMENCSAEILDVILLEALNRYGRNLICELDSTSKSVSELVDEALKILSGEVDRRIGAVNWLKEVYERGDLKIFFK